MVASYLPGKSILSSWSAGLSAIALIAIHVSPALSSIAFVLSALFGLTALLQAENGIKSLPYWVFIPVTLVLWQFACDLWQSQGFSAAKWQLKASLLCIPMLYGIKFVPYKYRLGWWTLISIVPCWIALASLVHYFQNYRFLNQMILESKPLPLYTLVYHIEFSVLLALSSLLALIFLIENRGLKNQFFYQLLWVVTLLNVLSLHLLTVRTGIAGFWAGALPYALYRVVHRGMKLQKFILAAILLAGVLACIPSVRNRISNTLEDFSAVSSGGDLKHKSFGQRWEAWHASADAIARKPAGGYGTGNVEPALSEAYQRIGSQLPRDNQVMPHNEFLDISIQSGIPAGALLLAFLLLLFFYGWKRENPFLIALGPAFLVAMCFESLLERQAGVLVLVVFSGMAAAYAKAEKTIPE